MNDARLSLAGDPDALATVERKLQLVRDLTTGVAKGFKQGFYLYGLGGHGKSFTVLDQLKLLQVLYELHNSRMTGKGLFLALKHAPDAIHLLEDMERLTKDADCARRFAKRPVGAAGTRTYRHLDDGYGWAGPVRLSRGADPD